MARCLQRVGVLVASVRNLAFLVLPEHWQGGRLGALFVEEAARLADRQKVLEAVAKQGAQGRQGRQGRMDLAIGYGIDLPSTASDVAASQARASFAVLRSCTFARWARLDISPFQIKFRLSASWVIMGPFNGVPERLILGFSVDATVKSAILLPLGPMSLV